MKPTIELDRVETESGSELILHEHDGTYVIRVDGETLMSSRMHASEEDMAQLAFDALAHRAGARVLAGGLGMGFTLRAALDLTPEDGDVVVAEFFADVVRWNREVFGHLAGEPLADERVEVFGGDVRDALRTKGPFDIVLLDVDNGPQALTLPSNSAIYGRRGLELIAASLSRGGVAAVWSASPDDPFLRRAQKAGFQVATHTVRARRAKRGPQNTIYLLTRSVAPARREHRRWPARRL